MLRVSQYSANTHLSWQLCGKNTIEGSLTNPEQWFFLWLLVLLPLTSLTYLPEFLPPGRDTTKIGSRLVVWSVKLCYCCHFLILLLSYTQKYLCVCLCAHLSWINWVYQKILCLKSQSTVSCWTQAKALSQSHQTQYTKHVQNASESADGLRFHTRTLIHT